MKIFSLKHNYCKVVLDRNLQETTEDRSLGALQKKVEESS